MINVPNSILFFKGLKIILAVRKQAKRTINGTI